jgi:hypothetical protein
MGKDFEVDAVREHLLDVAFFLPACCWRAAGGK